MKIDVVTTIPLTGYELFAKQNYMKFLQHWPSSVQLHVFSEDKIPQDFENIKYYDLYEISPECKKFVTENKKRKWKPKYRQKLYKGLFIKFCYKVYSICIAQKIIDSDILIWLDSDIVTIKDIPLDIINKQIEDNTVLCYFNRDKSLWETKQDQRVSSETGLIIFNMNNLVTKEFFKRYQKIYDSGKLFEYDEVHDAFVFDELVKQMENEGKGNFVKLTNGKHTWPLPQTEFGQYLLHRMGKKKWKIG